MNDGQNVGDSASALTVDSAAPLLNALFSDDSEETQTETQTDDETPAAQSSPEDTKGEDTPASEDQSNSDEEGPEASDDAEAESTDDEEQPELIPVKANGEELKVTLDELKKGYSREKDYTLKSQKLADERRRHEAEVAPEREAVRADRQRYASQLSELETALKSLVQEPDWDKLRVESPDLFADTWAAWSDHKKRIDAITAERTAEEAKVRKDYDASMANHFAAERAKLLAAVPEWADATVGKKESDEVLAYGKKLGFHEDEIRGVSDHRALVALRKAMLYDRAQETADKARQTARTKIEKVKAAAPGAAGNKKPVTDVTRAKQRHAKVRTTESAGQVLSLMFED